MADADRNVVQDDPWSYQDLSFLSENEDHETFGAVSTNIWSIRLGPSSSFEQDEEHVKVLPSEEEAIGSNSKFIILAHTLKSTVQSIFGNDPVGNVNHDLRYSDDLISVEAELEEAKWQADITLDIPSTMCGQPYTLRSDASETLHNKGLHWARSPTTGRTQMALTLDERNSYSIENQMMNHREAHIESYLETKRFEHPWFPILINTLRNGLDSAFYKTIDEDPIFGKAKLSFNNGSLHAEVESDRPGEEGTRKWRGHIEYTLLGPTTFPIRGRVTHEGMIEEYDD
ncbi:hypothetical protein V865_007264 [Kwoniella europaea PYCC6329]|uniref:Uncharacterized protein n=1 Tax=Kwoniella europaea PYCC6329 TaxID=1423913 RepID=A0AAX4KTJ4_9TREE